MPTFEYKAKDGPGRTVYGEVDADSRGAAAAAVDAMGYVRRCYDPNTKELVYALTFDRFEMTEDDLDRLADHHRRSEDES